MYCISVQTVHTLYGYVQRIFDFLEKNSNLDMETDANIKFNDTNQPELDCFHFIPEPSLPVNGKSNRLIEFYAT
jgi:hypothetical protein